MKRKSILNFLFIGLFAGFVFGLIQAASHILSNKYFYYRLYRLILFELTGNINKGIICGLAIAIILILFITAFDLLWKKLLSTYLEIKLIRKNKLTPLFKTVFSLLLFSYLAFQISKHIWNPGFDSKEFLWQSLAVLILLIFINRIENIIGLLSKSRFIFFIKKDLLKITTIAIVAIFSLFNSLSLSQNLFYSPSGPNVLLIVADALRADHLGCYGYNRPTSPHIDKFASDAVVFEKAFSNAPWTKPSMGTIFTSLYPHEHQAFYWTDNLSDECLTLAEVFRNNNYTTFAFQTNPHISKNHNFQQGFRYYNETILEKGEYVTSIFNSWLKRHRKKPFFAYLHYMDTHIPYNGAEEFIRIFGLNDKTLFTPGQFQTIDVRLINEIGLTRENKQSLINLYDGAIKYFDHNFLQILENLIELDILNKTIIILTADHGEEFWEHNGFAHGHSIYNEVIHVPLIIKYSSKFQKKTIKSYVQLLDIFPTIISLASIKNVFGLRGKDLIPSIINDKEIKTNIYFEGIICQAEKKGIIKNGWKLIENTGKKNSDTVDLLDYITKYIYPYYEMSLELYNTDLDFSEKHNLIGDFPQIASELQKRLFKFRMNQLVLPSQKKTGLKEKLDDMKSLGYIK